MECLLVLDSNSLVSSERNCQRVQRVMRRGLPGKIEGGRMQGQCLHTISSECLGSSKPLQRAYLFIGHRHLAEGLLLLLLLRRCPWFCVERSPAPLLGAMSCRML